MKVSPIASVPRARRIPSLRPTPRWAAVVLVLATAGSPVMGWEPPASAGKPAKVAWRSLFNGKDLSDWKVPAFGGEGEVKVEGGAIWVIEGNPMSGITYSGKQPLPQMNYELQLEAKRTRGIDFFCGLTFPVNDSHCSLIVSGWSGSVVGLSNIDDRDASENASTRLMDFKDDRWYKVRVRVTKTKIEAWLDDTKVVNQVITGKKIGVRPEVDLSKPLGLSTFQTAAAWRKIQIRSVAAPADQSTQPLGDKARKAKD